MYERKKTPRDEKTLKSKAALNQCMLIVFNLILLRSTQKITANNQDTRIDKVENKIEIIPYPSHEKETNIPYADTRFAIKSHLYFFEESPGK